ncbi:MAG: serine/threonine protein kinase [Planctomycetota bacterium]|jgi:serine/threonine protein kinase/tetratricopeptide (TPR) repeat protein
MNTPRVEDLLSDALSWSPDERAVRLDEACGGDARLRAEIESLLDAHEQAGAFMAEPSVEPAVTSPLGEGPGTVVGPYRLLQLIGEGGFGAVFMAEQREPVRRRVAVKVIKLGMDTRHVIARFEAERQALALMDHPNIARVLDAGATEAGRPYFVMELVRGEPITAYCDRANLAIPARLDLFRQVCHAVQHAHQKGVIHRDLKPSNILVAEIDGRPTPRIIDFGIAKATGGHGRLTDKTLFTDFRQFVGTPEYMSPEQAGAGVVDIDTRSDVYALGVLLYELLTGGPPFDPHRLRSAEWEEMRRIIREDEPQRPSTRLHSHEDTREVATRRRTEPAQLVGVVRGDLDWIVMKCLEKDRGRRYETANALAMDIGRYLAGEPVVAAPPSRAYRLRKFAARHRGPVAAAVAIALVLMLGMVGTTAGLAWALREADRAQHAEDQAQQRAADLEQVADFQQSQLADLDAAQMGKRLRLDIIERRRTALELAGLDEAEVQRDLLDLERSLEGVNFVDVAKGSLDENIFEGALKEIETRFAEQPLVQARLLQSVANALRSLELPDRAEAPQEQALEIRRRELGDAHPDTLRSLVQTGGLNLDQSRHEDAESSLRRAVETARRELGAEHRLTLWAINKLGVLLHWRGKYAESAECWSEVLEIGRRVLGEEDKLVMGAMGNLSFALDRLGNHAEAEAMIRECLRRRRRVLGNEHQSTLWAAGRLGQMLRDQGKLEEAEPYVREVLEGRRRMKGDEHNTTLWAMRGLGELLRKTGELEEAERLGAEAVERGRRLWPNERPTARGRFLIGHARTLTALKRFEPAEAELLEALAMLEYPGGPVTSRPWFDRYTSELTEGFAELYEAWHAAEPDAGYDAGAAEVRARIQAAHAAHADGGDLSGPGDGPGG